MFREANWNHKNRRITLGLMTFFLDDFRTSDANLLHSTRSLSSMAAFIFFDSWRHITACVTLKNAVNSNKRRVICLILYA